MRITIVTGPWLPVPALQGGSTNRIWQELAESFAAKKHEVCIVSRAYPSQPPQEIIRGVNYIRLSGFKQSSHIALDLMKDFFYAVSILPHLPKAEILVTHDFWLPVLAPHKRPDAGKVVLPVGRYPKGQFCLYGKAVRFVALSNSVKKAIIAQLPSTTTKVRVIPNPIDTSIFKPISSPLKESPGVKTILFAGRIHPEKGVHLLVDAFKLINKKIQNVKMLIIGPHKPNQGGGGIRYLNDLRKKSLGLSIEIKEPIFDKQMLAEIFQEAEIFCYPSLAEKGESCPVAVLEAMASGVPPIVSSLECFHDYIDEGITGYFFDHRKGRPEVNLADCLASAMSNQKKLHLTGERCVQKAQEFNVENISNLYLSDFMEILKNYDQ